MFVLFCQSHMLTASFWSPMVGGIRQSHVIIYHQTLSPDRLRMTGVWPALTASWCLVTCRLRPRRGLAEQRTLWTVSLVASNVWHTESGTLFISTDNVSTSYLQDAMLNIYCKLFVNSLLAFLAILKFWIWKILSCFHASKNLQVYGKNSVKMQRMPDIVRRESSVSSNYCGWLG